MKHLNFTSTLVLMIILSCNNNNSPRFQELTLKGTIRERLYKSVPDSPLSLYCYIDGRLSPAIRQKLCDSLLLKYDQNLTLELTISVRNSKITELAFQGIFFDASNFAHKVVISDSIQEIIKGADLMQSPGMKGVSETDIAVRLQLERFCIGYMEFVSGEIPDVAK